MLLSLPLRRARRRRRAARVDNRQSQHLTERLEDRTLLAAFTVTSVADSIDSNLGNGFAADSNGETTLRAAIQESNALAGADVIILPTGTFALTRGGSGEDNSFSGDLDVTGELTIIGAGAAQTIIDGNDLDRVLHVLPGANLKLSGVTIRNGSAINAGGLHNGGTLELIDSIIEDNEVSGADNSVGGGIGNSVGLLSLTRVTVRGNSATVNGGGLYNSSGIISITDSTFENNSADIDGGGLSIFNGSLTMTGGSITGNSAGVDGGGLSVENALVSLTEVTVSSNTAVEDGGGLNSFGSAELRLFTSTVTGNIATSFGGGIRNFGATLGVTDSTISNNQSGTSGGGIDNDRGLAEITNSIIANNLATEDGGGTNNFMGTLGVSNSTYSANQATRFGGGVHNGDSATATIINATLTLNTAGETGGGIHSIGSISVGNTIVAGNTAIDFGPDVVGVFTTLGTNIIGDVGPALGLVHDTDGDQVGTSGSPIDPLLSPLGDNGGPTLSHALTIDSPAIDAGTTDGAAAADQTGNQRLLDGDRDGNLAVDIGAVEFRNTTATFTVNTTNDTTDDTLADGLAEDDDGNTSLRSAIQEAATAPGDARINLPAGTYTLSISGSGEDLSATGDLDIGNHLTIEGAGSSNTIIDGDQLDRIFHVLPGVTFALIGVTLRNGSAGFGGGFYNQQGQVLLRDVVVTGNSANGLDNSHGGGIANDFGLLILEDVTVNDNSAEVDGGGIYSFNAGLQILDSSIESNSAGRAAGGIGVEGGGFEIVDSTVSGNTSVDDGGGAAVGSGADANFFSTIIRDNSSDDFGGGLHIISSAVSLTESTVSGNSAAVSGGGINTEDATLNLFGSTIHSNSAAVDGGGIDSYRSTVSLSSSTVSGNSAGLNGGGIVNYSVSTVELISTTIADNSSGNFGGGIWTAGMLRLGNSIVARNFATNGAIDISGTAFSLGTNLIGIDAGLSGPVNGANGDIIGTFNFPADPVISPLQDNGGSTLTHIPLFDSPLIEAGTFDRDISIDQRGQARVRDGDFDGTSRTDIGATEFFGITLSFDTTSRYGDGDSLRINRVDDNLQIIDDDSFGSGGIVALPTWINLPASEVDQFRIIGNSDRHDVVIGTGSASALPTAGLIIEDTGSEDGDTLHLDAGTADSVDWTFTSADSGTVVIDGRIVEFSGVEAEVDDRLAADSRSFTFENSTDILVINENGSSDDGVSTLDIGNGARSIDFRVPTTMLAFDLGGGADSLLVNSIDSLFTGSVQVLAGDGTDSIDLAAITADAFVDGGAGADTIVSGSGNDTLRGSGAPDRILAGAGDDIVAGGASVDFLDGEDGDDLVLGQGAAGDHVTGGNGDDTLDGGGGVDFLVETVTGSVTLTTTSMVGLGTDVIRNLNRARLTGSSADNTIDTSGFDGDATIDGAAGNDRITTGDGNDRIAGSAGNDTIRAGAGNDRLYGGAGKDLLYGDAGQDRLYGNGGSGDRLSGGLGDDSINGGSGTDRVIETTNGNLILTQTSMLGLGNDRLVGIENASITGGATNNLLDASAFTGMVILDGADGNDTLIGGTSGDSLMGGMGDDSLLGRLGDDTLRGGDGDDTLKGDSGDDHLDGGAGDDAITGRGGNDFLLGQSGNDTLLGDDGDDTLFGGSNRDTVIGGIGIDRVTGNSGQDLLAGGALGNSTAESGDVINGDALEIDEAFSYFAQWMVVD